MKKNYFFLVLLLPILGFSQGRSFWKPTNDNDFRKDELLVRTSNPTSYDTYRLDLNSLKQQLANAPDRDLNIQSEIVVQFPGAEGKMENFEVYNASIMEPSFAAQYPDIQSYVAVSRENTGTVIRFSTTIFGFHATVHAIGKTMYIDPMTTDLQTYMMYEKANLYREMPDDFSCLVEDDGEDLMHGRSNDTNFTFNANDGQLRTLRLALACTQEYANYHINAAGQAGATDAIKRATVLAAMNVTMTRVNALFERDLSVTMTLVNNTSIIFLAEDDGYTDDNPGALLSQNQSIVDANIGTANYDIGHVFTTGGGGVAILNGICFSNVKAQGVTGSDNPVGDPFDVDFVAHEIGHQFGATHIFNGTQGNCSGGNRTAATSVEPGSGTTIMGYAGICGSDNIQNNSDDHFNAISIDNMWARLNQNPICATNTPNGNAAPTVNAGADYTIPFGTAFTLTGSASDANGTTLSYCWEQVDPGVTAGVPSPTDTSGPMFRSYSPVATPDRTFPQLSDVLNGNLTPQWEVMPNVARTMNFALTVRDNGTPNGGQTNRDDMRVTVANTGPFRVTSPNMTNESFPTNSTTNITWDVAGTTGNGINTSNVNILLSTDGGLTFPTVLAANTPNDGSQSITFPVIFEPYCRIKIEAVGNVYFAISTSFSVGGTLMESCNTYTTGPISIAIPDGVAPNQQGNAVATPAINVTETTAITDIRVTTDISHPWIGDLYLRLQSPNNGPVSDFWVRGCNGARFTDINATFRDGEATVACASPTVGTFAPPSNGLLATLGGINPSGNWTLVAADFYNGDIGTINQVSIELCSETFVLSTEEFELDNFTLYPNPNKGEFTLSFNSTSGEDINVEIHDIAGRLIQTKNYSATSAFNENISLRNVSTGMYLITVTDQEKKVTKKLIVE